MRGIGVTIGGDCYAKGSVAAQKEWFQAKLIATRDSDGRENCNIFRVEYIARLDGNTAPLCLPAPRITWVPRDHVSSKPPTEESEGRSRKRSATTRFDPAPGVNAPPQRRPRVGATCFARGSVAAQKEWFRAKLLATRESDGRNMGNVFKVEYIARLDGGTAPLSLPAPRVTWVPRDHLSVEPPSEEPVPRKRAAAARFDPTPDVHGKPKHLDGKGEGEKGALRDKDGRKPKTGEWLHSPRAQAGRSQARVGIGKDHQASPLPRPAVASALAPPAPPPVCLCGRPAAWARSRWWCADEDGCTFETEAPEALTSPTCECGVRAVLSRELWRCARTRAAGGCEWIAWAGKTPSEARAFIHDDTERAEPELIPRATLEEQIAESTAERLTTAAYVSEDSANLAGTSSDSEEDEEVVPRASSSLSDERRAVRI